MTAELERLKTTCLAQEAEIARLQAGFDELKKLLHSKTERKMTDNFDHGYIYAIGIVLKEINRITGEEV